MSSCILDHKSLRVGKATVRRDCILDHKSLRVGKATVRRDCLAPTKPCWRKGRGGRGGWGSFIRHNFTELQAKLMRSRCGCPVPYWGWLRLFAGGSGDCRRPNTQTFICGQKKRVKTTGPRAEFGVMAFMLGREQDVGLAGCRGQGVKVPNNGQVLIRLGRAGDETGGHSMVTRW